MRRGVLAIAVVVTGCDRVYGLDGRTESPSDSAVDAREFPIKGDVQPGDCWSADPTTHDEDGDGILDGCDNCPAIPNDQVDVDSDGVGDPCDPNPGYAVDQIVFFAGMKADSSLLEWTRRGGDWAFVTGIDGTDCLRQQSIDAGQALALAMPAAIVGPTIDVQVRTISPMSTTGYGWGVLALRGPLADSPDGIACNNTVEDGPDQLQIHHEMGGEFEGIDTASQPVGSGAPHHIRLSTFPIVDGVLRSPQCTSYKGNLTDIPAPKKTTVTLAVPVRPIEARVAIRTFSTNADIRSLTIYASRVGF